MSRITGKDTKPEMLLRSMLHRRDFRFTVNGAKNKKQEASWPSGHCSAKTQNRRLRPRLLLARSQGLQTLPSSEVAHQVVEGKDREDPGT
jgi:hypothetical protein